MLATSLAIGGFPNYITNATKEQRRNLKFGTCPHTGEQEINITIKKKNNELYKGRGPRVIKRATSDEKIK